MSPTVVHQPAGDIKSYYTAKIELAELAINRKTQNLRRLEAQRNALNARGASSSLASLASSHAASAAPRLPRERERPRLTPPLPVRSPPVPSLPAVRLLREELQLLQEPGSYVGEVVKVMGKTKVLVKVQPEGKYGACRSRARWRGSLSAEGHSGWCGKGRACWLARSRTEL